MACTSDDRHVGYNINPEHRGHRYAERACRLVIPLMTEIWITCDPDNHPSRRTCERLGAELIEIVDLPSDHEMYKSGDRRKCRYRLILEEERNRITKDFS